MTGDTLLTARRVRYARGAVSFAGGMAFGVLYALDRPLTGAGIVASSLLVAYVLPWLYGGPVSDERTRSVSEWASRTTLRIAGVVFTAGMVAGSVLHGLGYLTPSSEAIAATLAVGLLFLFYLLVVGYAVHVRPRVGWLP